MAPSNTAVSSQQGKISAAAFKGPHTPCLMDGSETYRICVFNAKTLLFLHEKGSEGFFFFFVIEMSTKNGKYFYFFYTF